MSDAFQNAMKLYEAENYAGAYRAFLHLARGGDPSAMVQVASMQSAAEGTSYNLDEAIEWEIKAAEMGEIAAILNLGISYRCKGEIKKARDCFLAAFEQGEPEAALELARLFSVSDLESQRVRDYASAALESGQLSEDSEHLAKNFAKID